MDFLFEEIKSLPRIEECDGAFGKINSEDTVFNRLIIKNRKYYFEAYSEAYFLENPGVVLVSMWNYIVLFSISDGKILYCSGLNCSFVAVEELKMDFLILTDNTLFLINKIYFYPWGFKIFTDDIQDYKVHLDDYNITLKFAVQDDIIIKLNTV